MDERAVRQAMSIDDAYVVERRLAKGPDGVTELVSIDGAGPFVRRRMPIARARRAVWAALADCQDPRLPHVRTSYELPDEYVVVLDYAEGETLADLVAREGALSCSRVRDLVVDLCGALSVLHAHGLVHRDVAPANIVVGEGGVHLIDFGNACLPALQQEEENPQGTWGFAAPEQHGFTQVDARADLYAVGRVAAFVLTGALPEGNTQRELRDHVAHLPEAVRAVIERACAFEPSARYQSAEELARAFCAACAGEAAPAEDAANSGAPTKDAVPVSAAAATPQGAAEVPPTTWPQPSAQEAPSAGRRWSAKRIVGVCAIALVVVVAIASVAMNMNQTWANSIPSEGFEKDGQVDADASAAGNAPAATDDSAATGVTAGISTDDVARAHAALKLAETGWSIDANGYISYAFSLENTSDDLLVDFPAVTITGYDDAGSVVSSDTMTLAALYPGQTQYCASIAGNGAGASAVEFSIGMPNDWDVRRTTGSASTYEVTDAALVSDGFGGSAATGKVRLAVAGDDMKTAMGSIALTALVRDDAGSIVASGETYIDMIPEGSTASFEIPLFTPAASGTLEVHARTW